MGRIRRPKLFENEGAPRKAMKNIGDTLVSGTLDEGMKAIRKMKPNVSVRKKPKYLEVTEKRLQKLGVIDLKPYFANSRKRIIKPGGGWYLRIPIKRKKRDMSRRMYEQLRTTNIAPNEKRTVISDYLYDRRRESQASALNYTPKSHNIEKKRVRANRHEYTAYRTVSNKSPASSWIVNRQRVSEDKESKTFVKNVNRLMKWKMKNGWG